MSPSVVLDSEAVFVLSGGRSAALTEIQAALEAARRLGRDVIIPTVVLAELYRGRQRSQLIDSMLSRETGIELRDTDRSFARLVGGILAAAGADSTLMVDAHAVAAAVEAGGGVIMTSDPHDLERLAANYANIHISKI